MIDPQLSEEAPAAISDRILRQFAGAWILFFGAWAGFQALARSNERLSWLFAGMALAVGLPGLLKPQIVRPLFVGLLAITAPIGWVVSHLILAIMFYGIFTPVAVVFKLIGRDVLCRKPASAQESYWTPKRQPTDLRQYLRQF